MTAPTAADLHHAAARVAVAGVRKDDADQAYELARKAAEPLFAAARKLGITQVAVTLPGGVQAGILALKAGGQTVTVDEAELLRIYAEGAPSETEPAAIPAAEADPRVLRLLAQHCPDLLEARVRPGALDDERALKVLAEHAADLVTRRIVPEERAQLQKYLLKHEGSVPDPATGEPVKVATITHHDATGAFGWTGKTEFMPRVREALESGRLVITANGDVAETLVAHVEPPAAIEGGEAA